MDETTQQPMAQFQPAQAGGANLPGQSQQPIQPAQPVQQSQPVQPLQPVTAVTQPVAQIPVPPQQTQQQNVQAAPHRAYAGFGKRLGANLIDAIILALLVQLPAFFLAGTGMLDLSESSYTMINLMYVVFTFSYFVYFTHKSGMTPGKKVMKIKVVDERGVPLTVTNVVIRETVGKIVSSLLFSLGYLWVIWDSKKQAWHDKIAHTIVVQSDDSQQGSLRSDDLHLKAHK